LWVVAAGKPDICTQLLAEQMQRDAVITVVVDNRAGWHGTIAIPEVEHAKPDRRTLLRARRTCVRRGDAERERWSVIIRRMPSQQK